MDKPNKAFNIIINSPNELIWEGRVTSVSSKNSVGPFDILYGHANFITMIQNESITAISLDGKKHSFKYESAVLSVYNEVVTIYAEI